MVPFLKWAGGKRWLASTVESLAGSIAGRYVEPFLGGGAIFFHLQPQNAILSDINGELITTYRVVRDQPDELAEALAAHQQRHSKNHYYEVRGSKPETDFELAVRFLYLNRTCWNGLYRVNRRGEFNVPKGTKSKIIELPDEFAAAAKLLASAELLASDFEVTIDRAGRGDLVYVDPPYTVKHNLNGFLKYNEVIFSWDDQLRLKDACLRAQARGATVIVSNAAHASIVDLYRDAEIHEVARASVISGQVSGRAQSSELVSVYRGLE